MNNLETAMVRWKSWLPGRGMPVLTYVGEDDQDAEDSDPNGHVQVGSPVLNNQTASSQVCRCRHNILQEVIPTCCKSMVRESVSTSYLLQIKGESYPSAGSIMRLA